MTDKIERALDGLRARMPGHVSRPGDESYALATEIWAKQVGAMPRSVVHCRLPEEVQLAVRTARDCDLPLSVRGGGHDWAGRALCEGIVIDLTGLRGVVVNDDKVAHVSGGALAADVVARADPLGLAAATGSCSSVGMAGLTLGGGYGPLIGRFGLALDNLLAAEVVLADGRIVVADSSNEAELFWALRGGGGNFGVVTAMCHRLHDLPTVRSGMLVYPFAEAKTVLEGVADLAASAPDELSVQIILAASPNGAPVVLVVPIWCGQPESGETWTAPFLRLGTLLSGSVDAMPYGAMLAMFDPFLVKGQRTFMETCSLPALDGQSIDVFIEAMGAAASQGCAIITHEFKGAASRVPAGATAFGLRRDHVVVEMLASFADRQDMLEERRHQRWLRATLKAFDAMALPGGYPNFLAASDTDRATKSFGQNADRLLEAKRCYDPDNVFSSTIPLPVAQDPASMAMGQPS